MSNTAPYQGLDKQTNEFLKQQERGFLGDRSESLKKTGNKARELKENK